MTTTVFRLVSAAVVVWASACNSTAIQQDEVWVAYWPNVVKLKGQLIEVEKYGPPNYGEHPETDAKLKVPILVVSPAVNVRGDSTGELNRKSIEGVTEIQLLLTSRSEEYRSLLSQEVVVTGTLSEATMGTHFTKIVMTVDSILRCR